MSDGPGHRGYGRRGWITRPGAVLWAGCFAAWLVGCPAQAGSCRTSGAGVARISTVSLWAGTAASASVDEEVATGRLAWTPRVIPVGWETDAGAPSANWPTLPGMAQARRAAGGSANKKAIVPALMSAAIPGAGQWKNGTILRALGFAAVEVTGWVAYLTFKDAADDKRGQMADFAEARWGYDRYHTIAPDPAACEEAGCPPDQWTAEADSIIVLAESSNRNRFLDYITRDAYACGWDTATSRHLYGGLWDDREDLLSAASFSGRMIFLNHLVSAVDAFLGARKVQIRLDEDTAMTLELQGVPDIEHPRLMLTSRLVPRSF